MTAGIDEKIIVSREIGEVLGKRKSQEF